MENYFYSPAGGYEADGAYLQAFLFVQQHLFVRQILSGPDIYTDIQIKSKSYRQRPKYRIIPP